MTEVKIPEIPVAKNLPATYTACVFALVILVIILGYFFSKESELFKQLVFLAIIIVLILLLWKMIREFLNFLEKHGNKPDLFSPPTTPFKDFEKIKSEIDKIEKESEKIAAPKEVKKYMKPRIRLSKTLLNAIKEPYVKKEDNNIINISTSTDFNKYIATINNSKYDTYKKILSEFNNILEDKETENDNIKGINDKLININKDILKGIDKELYSRKKLISETKKD